MEDYKVVMRNPDTGGVAEAYKTAFDEVWEPNGWVEVDPLAAHASRELDKPVDDVHKLLKGDLIAVAQSKGVPLDGSETKDEILERLEQTKES